MSERTFLSRVSAWAAPVLIILALIVGTFAGVVRYTPLLDPAVGAGGALPTDALHRDPKPCLRYPTPPLRSSIETASRALLDAGFTSADLSDVVGDLYARANAREAALHAESEVDEYLEVFRRGSGPLSRLVIALKRDRLRDQLTRILTMKPPVGRTVASLPEKPREAVEAQWARDPLVFVLPGLMDLSRQLKLDATNAKLDAVSAQLEAQVAAGELPSLEALRAGDAEATKDGWGWELSLERTADDELTLTSLGADQLPGGSGYDADLKRALKVKPLEAPPPAPSLECTGKTEFTLDRTEVDAALANPSEIAKEARVIPAVENGVVTGLKVKNLREGFFTRVGLCENDVVSTVNGFPLASPDKALEAYSALRNATRVEVALMRDGKPLTVTITLR